MSFGHKKPCKPESYIQLSNSDVLAKEYTYLGNEDKCSSDRLPMEEQILSPDGKMHWTGNEWVLLPPQLPITTFQDTVVMGDVKTEIVHQHTHSNTIQNTVVQDSEKLIRSHLNTMVDVLSEGRSQDAKEIFERAKQIDYDLAVELHNGEYLSSLRDAFYRHVEHYCVSHVLNYNYNRRRESINIYSQNLNNSYNIGIGKIKIMLILYPNFTPCLLLNVKMIRKGNLTKKQKLKQIAQIYKYVLSYEPQNEMVRKELDIVFRKQKIHLMIILVPIGLLIALIFF